MNDQEEDGVFIKVQIPSNQHSNEIQLMAALEKVTDILIDPQVTDAESVKRRVARWYAERYGK